MKSSFVITAIFPVRSSVLYRAFLDSEIHSAFTGSQAHVDDRVGGEFSAWDGYITGMTVGLEENRRIVQRWRTSDFADTDDDSNLEMEFVEKQGETTVILKHSNLPEGTDDEYKSGWEDYYFAPLKTFLEDQSKRAST
jgi:activator of HSP90 ATPase